MSRRGRIRAWFLREELIRRLGGECVDCGSRGSKKYPLEIDHPHGRDYDVRRMGSEWRNYRYIKEFREGVRLAVRCRRCNANAHKVRGQAVGALDF